MANATIRLWDRSRTVTDWQCPRKRYWQYEYDGTGLVGAHTPLELFLGQATHDGLAGIAHGVDIDEVAGAAQTQVYQALMNNATGDEFESIQYAMEQSALVEGMLRGYNKLIWPYLMTHYPEILAIERELMVWHNDVGEIVSEADATFGFMAKPDLVLRSRTGEAVYVEFKTTSSKRDDWIHSWETAVQLHATSAAIKETLGVDVDYVIVQGLYKGYQSYGKQNSPFCYAYGRDGIRGQDYRYDYSAGFKRFPAWQMEGGVKNWVAGMPDPILSEQFPQTPPIFVNHSLVGKFLRQRAIREVEIRDGKWSNVNLDTIFPQRFDQCVPGWGKGCSYRQLCFGNVGNPRFHGFEPRVPHHQPELDQWKQHAAAE